MLTDKQRDSARFLVAEIAEVRSLLLRAVSSMCAMQQLIAQDQIPVRLPLTSSVDNALSDLGALCTHLQNLLIQKNDVASVDC